MHRGFFSDIVLCLFLAKFWPLLQFLNLKKYFLTCSIQTAYFEEFCLFITWMQEIWWMKLSINERWFLVLPRKSNLKDIANYPCIYTWSSFATAEIKCCEIESINKITKLKLGGKLSTLYAVLEHCINFMKYGAWNFRTKAGYFDHRIGLYFLPKRNKIGQQVTSVYKLLFDAQKITPLFESLLTSTKISEICTNAISYLNDYNFWQEIVFFITFLPNES